MALLIAGDFVEIGIPLTYPLPQGGEEYEEG
jgi:hypothetical protein